MPLILEGARQVGKTWLLKTFGEKCFDSCLYINFEQAEGLLYGQVFEKSLSPQEVIPKLEIMWGRKIEAERTLIIFGEVQNVPRALTALKYFQEEAPQYAICCAGSLLGISIHEGTSFPVGKVNFLCVNPLSFKEFLLASGEKMIVDYIMGGRYDIDFFREKLVEYLKLYMVIGGMPGVVNCWLEPHDMNAVVKMQQSLLDAYDYDMTKHAPERLLAKIRGVWKSIPSQLAKENKKFVYGLVREGARGRDYEDTLQWLDHAGLIKRDLCKTSVSSEKS